jgi:tartrate dehydrogenase/decarboxylase/D-malate dehydrogenase
MRHRIAALAGDGIGPEIVPQAKRVLDLAGEKHRFHLDWVDFDWGSDYYRSHSRMMPVDALETLSSFDAIFLGAVGQPDIPDSETLWGMLIPIRRAFDQYINLRPIESLPGVVAPIATQNGIDLVIVRENVEGEYSAIGGRSYSGQPEEAAYQMAVFTRRGIARTARYAAELARTRTGHLASATKSNGIIHTMTFWDEVVKEVVDTYPDVALSSVLVDALAANLVMHPDRFDVIVASNLFGDILSDIAAATVGSIGIAPSANLNPERKSPSMFEPVHGSAPDIAGRGIANPLGQIWAGSLMLDHLGHAEAAADIKRGFREALALGVATADLGGAAGTVEFTNAVLDALAAN